MLDAADILAIHQLLARYGQLLDARRWDDFAELFTEDATIDYRGGRGTTERAGRAAIVAWFRELDDTHPPAHHVTNIIVDDGAEPGDTVEVLSKFIAPFTRQQHVPKRMYGGDYRDLVVKTDGRWRFAHKQCIPRWQLAVQVDETAPDHRRTY